MEYEIEFHKQDFHWYVPVELRNQIYKCAAHAY